MYYLFELLGWQFAGGFGVGVLLFGVCFRIYYGWWPDFGTDGQDAENQKLPRLKPDSPPLPEGWMNHIDELVEKRRVCPGDKSRITHD